MNADTAVNTIDVVAIQRFFLGLATGIGNTGLYQFIPASRTYSGMVSDETAQDYDTLVSGDVVSPFAERVENSPDSAATDILSGGKLPASVAALLLPNITNNGLIKDFIGQVATTTIDAKDKLIGFQGDLVFDERVVAFQKEPVQKAGLTNGNWDVSGNILAGKGPIRTLRISAYSKDFTPLSGSGTLFELRMTQGRVAYSTTLFWAAPPNHFIFIDADLNTQKPGYAGAGGITWRRAK